MVAHMVSKTSLPNMPSKYGLGQVLQAKVESEQVGLQFTVLDWNESAV